MVKKATFIKQEEARRLLSSLGIKAPLKKTPLLGPLLFWKYQQVNRRYKMNEIVYQFSLEVNKIMLEKSI